MLSELSKVGISLLCTKRNVVPCTRFVRSAAVATKEEGTPLPDKLYSSVEIEYRAHDKEVLKSYSTFLEAVCNHLDIQRGKFEVLPYIRWVQPALRSKFVHKKYKLHYETRTHITKFEIKNVTGSTASTFLEYVQRNIPEGVGMRVGYTELQPLPSTISKFHSEASDGACGMSLDPSNPDDDKILEVSTDFALGMLLNDATFVTDFEERVHNKLLANSNMSTSKEIAIERRNVSPVISLSTEIAWDLSIFCQQFSKEADFLKLHTDPEHNRDATQLFESNLKMERAIKASTVMSKCQALAVAGRRLVLLIKGFMQRMLTSGMAQIETCTRTAQGICELGVKFEQQIKRILADLISIEADEKEAYQFAVDALNKALIEYNVLVVDKLERLRSKFRRESTKAHPIRSSSQQTLLTRKPLPTTLNTFQSRQKGYLVPQNLIKSKEASHLMVNEEKEKRRARKSESLTKKQSGDAIDDSVMRNARTVSKQVVAEVRKALGDQGFVYIKA